MKLKGKVAVVTGGARDIGRAVSVKLAREGAKVVVNYHSSEAQAESTLKQILDAGGEAVAVRADVTTPKGVDRLVAETIASYGETIDILVNVAGGLVARKTLEEADLEFFEFVQNNPQARQQLQARAGRS